MVFIISQKDKRLFIVKDTTQICAHLSLFLMQQNKDLKHGKMFMMLDMRKGEPKTDKTQCQTLHPSIS